MMEGATTDIASLKSFLLRFQKMSGLTINFDKSKVMAMGYLPAKRQSIADRLKCQLGSFPTSYLEIPISDSRLSVADLCPSVAKLQHRVEPWQGRWLSKAARTVLINSSLSLQPTPVHHELL